MTKSKSAFTIVELVVVIAVIGILAAIAIVSYTAIQARARDGVRNQNVATLVRIVNIYLVNGYSFSSCGAGDGTGWLNATYGSNKTIMQCLIDSGVITEQIKDPKFHPIGIGLYNCEGTYWVATRLETSNDQSTITSGPFSTCHWKSDALNAGYMYVKQVNT